MRIRYYIAVSLVISYCPIGPLFHIRDTTEKSLISVDSSGITKIFFFSPINLSHKVAEQTHFACG